MTLLKNATWSKKNVVTHGDIRVRKGRVLEIGEKLDPENKEGVVDLAGHYIYPGLINAHDHLEMNLYSKLGHPPYNNYLEWAKDIYKPKDSPIKEIERVHINDRLLWGGLKNLISGVTTVIHHNPRKRILSWDEFPVRVPRDVAWAHSVGLGKDIVRSFPKKKTPFVIHAAEGVDSIAQQEIEKLKKLSLLKSNTALVHVVGAKAVEIQLIKEAKASVIWCPASNYYMFNTTAVIDQISPDIQVSLGTDSTLTGSATLLDEMKFAADCKLVNNETIYAMVSNQAATIFNLEKPEVEVNSAADFFCLPIKRSDNIRNIFESNPSEVTLVMVNGDIKLVDLKTDTNELPKHTVCVGSKEKRVSMDVINLKKRIAKQVPAEMLELNPLWNLID